MKRFAQVMVFVLVLCVAPSIFAQPVAAQEDEGGGGQLRAYFEIDRFTYRAAFDLEDGTEALLIRSSYKVNYLYQHHQPTLNHHYMTVSVGFYFGKTMLGRSLIQSVTFDEVAFYPKWRDSAGYAHDLFLDTPIFTVSGAATDGEIVGGYMLIDGDAISRYLPMFGGSLAISGLTLGLADGSEVSFDDTLYIGLEKYSNEFAPRNATLSGGNGVAYDSSDGYINIHTTGSAQFVMLLDLILGFSMIGTAGVLVVLGVLHIKGRITLPLSRIRSVMQKPVTPHTMQ